MSAALTDKLNQVAVAGSETTLAAPGKAFGANNFNLTSPSGWPTATGVILGMRRVDSNGVYVPGTYTEWIGVLSGSNMTINPTPLYGTDPAGGYAADGLTQVFIPVSASLWNNLIAALLADHFQNGGHGTLHDTNGKAILDLIATASAVNNLLVKNAATGNGPTLAVEGSDASADLNINALGTTGKTYVDGAAPQPFAYANGQNMPWVESGCVISNPSGLNWSMTAGVVWVNGKRYNVPAQSSTAATASKDVYIDILVGAGQNASNQSIVVTNVTNGAASPALAANSIRVGKLVTGASTLTIQQWGLDAVTTSGQVNYIYNQSPTAAPIFTLVNTGSAGGQMWYKNQNGVKDLWGQTSTVAGTTTGGSNGQINFPSSFLNAIETAVLTIMGTQSTNQQYANWGGGYPTPTVGVINCQSATNTGNTLVIGFLVRGF